MFRRKAYDLLKKWKKESNGTTAILIEGARRVGKSTVAENFAQNEYEDYILIDFSTADDAVKRNFENIGDSDTFFRNLFVLTGKSLEKRKGLIIFDEIQFYPKARQAIKQLVKDGRFDYIETGSLISISSNVKDILIPSEEESIKMHPMDFEEFLWANGNAGMMEVIRSAFDTRTPLGIDIHRKIMQTFRTYMAVGGMPQAVAAYVDGKNYREIDRIKQSILRLYGNDLKKYGTQNGEKADAIFRTLPEQLMNRNSIFKYSGVEQEARYRTYGSAVDFLNESMVVNSCVNVSAPEIALEMYAKRDRFKMFMGDTGLLVSAILKNGGNPDKMYRSLVIDNLGINQGMIFENMVAQMLVANGNDLFFHEFEYSPEADSGNKKYEIDFLTVREKRIVPIEVKSSGYKSHKSFDYFKEKYKLKMNNRYIVYTKDLEVEDDILFIPIYMTSCI